MEINTFNWTLVSLVHLDHVLRTQVVELDLFVMGTRSNAVSQRMEFDLVDHTSVLLVCLDCFLCSEIPNSDHFVITRDDVSCNWRKLTVSHPVVMSFQRILQSTVHCRPHLHQLVVSTRRQQQTIT